MSDFQPNLSSCRRKLCLDDRNRNNQNLGDIRQNRGKPATGLQWRTIKSGWMKYISFFRADQIKNLYLQRVKMFTVSLKTKCRVIIIILLTKAISAQKRNRRFTYLLLLTLIIAVFIWFNISFSPSTHLYMINFIHSFSHELKTNSVDLSVKLCWLFVEQLFCTIYKPPKTWRHSSEHVSVMCRWWLGVKNMMKYPVVDL